MRLVRYGRVEFVPLESAETDLVPIAGSALYGRWAGIIAPAVIGALRS